MRLIDKYILSLRSFLAQVGELAYFTKRFFTELPRRPYEFAEFTRQCYQIGNRSLPLVAVTAFIIGMVFALQSRPTLE